MRNSWYPKKSLALLPLLALLVAASPAVAQDHRDASVGFYLEEADRFPVCSRIEPPSCGDGDVPLTGELYLGYYAYLCIFSGNSQIGVAGVQCAIEFDDATRSGVDIDSWTACANGLDVPQDGWGQTSGDGNTITWNTAAGGCQREEPGGFGTGVTAVAGFFYVTAYSEDLLKIIPWRGTSGAVQAALKVVDCGDDESSGGETVLAIDHAGSVGFSDDGSVTGDLPCIQRVQEETTWGSVKDLYNNR